MNESKSFQDHFSGHAATYARFRPTYPWSLYSALADLAPARRAAWDVGCGNGQAACALADRFEQVFATDASAAQIANAEPHAAVRYSVESAEDCQLPDRVADLVFIGQALHWFNFSRFYEQARRVASSGAIIAAVAYELAQIDPAVDAAVRRFYRADIGPYWPADRGHIESGYREIPWPFTPIQIAPQVMTARWTLSALLGYLGTWSAVARYRAATGRDPLPEVERALLPVWGDPEHAREVRWPLVVRVGRVEH